MADPPVWVMCPGKEVLMVSIMRRVLTDVFPEMVKKRAWAHVSGVSRCFTKDEFRSRGSHWAGKVAGRLVKQRGVDIVMDADVESSKKLGDLLFKRLFEKRRDLGIQFLVWDEQTTINGKVQKHPIKPMTTEQRRAMKPWGLKSHLHRDHIHVEFDRVTGDQNNSKELENVLTAVKDAVGSP
jgi:hypothetical protein